MHIESISTFLISIVGGAILALLLSGCGVRAGDSFVVGTTGFLAEHNARYSLSSLESGERSEPHYHTEEDKRALNDVLRRY